MVQRALTGIKPTGNVHVGNYLGMIRPALELQETYEAYYFIADYHAMTTEYDGPTVHRYTLETAATWLALGLDPDRTRLFRQSAIPEVCELAWILSCHTPLGLLDRGHAVKAARDDGREVNAGLLYYPVLMAADILLYGSAVVPVGRDQKQHVEMARDIALKVNFLWGEDTLVVPEVLIRDEVAVVPGLDGRKMSKSYGNEIGLWLSSKPLRKRVMRIVTDSTPMEEPKDPDTDNVFQLYALFATKDRVEDLRQRYLAGGLGYGHAKQELFEVMDALLAEPRERYHQWMAEPDRLEAVLADGARRARTAAERTLGRVRSRAGILP
jgi:tryptophanyl-tRNA synthetase